MKKLYRKLYYLNRFSILKKLYRKLYYLNRFFNFKMLYRKVLLREKEFSEFSEYSPKTPAPCWEFFPIDAGMPPEALTAPLAALKLYVVVLYRNAEKSY